MKKVEKRLEDLIQYVNHSLVFVETKHGSFIALCIVFLIGIVEHFMNKDNNSECGFIFGKILVLIAFIVLIAAFSTSLLAFYPMKKSLKCTCKKSLEEIGSFFRCENLEHCSPELLMTMLSEGEEEYEFDDFEKQKIERILNTSKVVARKYRLFRCSIRLFSMFILLFVLMFVLTCF